MTAKAVVVAADALRTPAAAVRLGHPPAGAGALAQRPAAGDRPDEVDAPPAAAALTPLRDGRDNVSGVTGCRSMSLISVPRSADADGYFADRLYPAAGDPAKPVVGLGLFRQGAAREEDRIVFSDDTDAVGLPKNAA